MQRRAVVYLRASLDPTGEGASVTRQEEACRGLAVAKGLDVIAVESDNSISASTGKHRPAWESVLSMIEADEVDVVIAYHMDRITRTMTDLERLILLCEEHGVGVATATGDVDLTTDSGRMVARILAAVARAEVERKGERQKLAYRQKAKAGTPNWGIAPFGFHKNGTVKPDEAEALAQAYRDVLKGSPLRTVAERLNDDGFRTPYGEEWTGHTLRPVLLNARNVGKVTYRGEVVADLADGEPIVAEDTFYAVKHLLTDPSRFTGGGGAVSSLLTGIAECGNCGASVKVNYKGRKGNGGYRRYACSAKGCVTMPQEFVDGQVFQRLIFDAQERWGQSVLPESDPEKVQTLTEEQEALMVRMDEVAVKYAEGDLPMGAFTTATERIKARLSEIESELASLGSTDDTYVYDPEFLAQEFDGMPLERQRQVVRDVFQRIVLLPRGRGVAKIGPEHIATLIQGDDPESLDLDPPRRDPYIALADALVEEQSEDVTTLNAAAEWLRERGLTTSKVSTVRTKLSAYVRYDRAESEWVRKSV